MYTLKWHHIYAMCLLDSASACFCVYTFFSPRVVMFTTYETNHCTKELFILSSIIIFRTLESTTSTINCFETQYNLYHRHHCGAVQYFILLFIYFCFSIIKFMSMLHYITILWMTKSFNDFHVVVCLGCKTIHICLKRHFLINAYYNNCWFAYETPIQSKNVIITGKWFRWLSTFIVDEIEKETQTQ